MSTDTETAAKTHPFQAEVAELLNLMVHAVYSETDIFLRELISNASDACDKLRYEAIAKPDLDCRRPARHPHHPDTKAGTLTIADNGIGMDRQELIDNLGTVARSGTKAFISQLAEAKDGAGLIGKFGVGFYSAFMVSDRIEVTSRRAGASEAWVWSSGRRRLRDRAGERGAGRSRAARDRDRAAPKEDAKKYVEAFEIERIVHTYSEHIRFRSSWWTPKARRQINAASALWQRSEVGAQARGVQGGLPLDRRRVRRAGDDAAPRPRGGSLTPCCCSRRRPGRSTCSIPDARVGLNSMCGVCSSPTTPSCCPPTCASCAAWSTARTPLLNISREMLQNNPQVAQMRKALTGRVLTELDSLAEKTPETYAKIWEAFGPVLKEGIYEDHERRDQLLALARFATTKDGPDTQGARSLKQYVADLKPNQTEIYYLVGESAARLKSNPKLEARARGIEVLLLTDPVDAF